MSWGDRTPTMSAAEFRAFRGRLAALGVELAGDAQFTYSYSEHRHNLSVPHLLMQLNRVGEMTPDYTVAGFSECVICHHMVYMDIKEVHLLERGALGFCRLCQPRDFCEESPAGVLHGITFPTELLDQPPENLRDYLRDALAIRLADGPGDLL